MSGAVQTQKTIYDLTQYEKRLNLNDSFLSETSPFRTLIFK